jgi:large subunit ribosomal protein L33
MRVCVSLFVRVAVLSAPAASPRSPSNQSLQRREAIMPKNDKRVKITLECTECKRRNYITMKSKINDRERMEMKKYCSFDRKHTPHKETR